MSVDDLTYLIVGVAFVCAIIFAIDDRRAAHKRNKQSQHTVPTPIPQQRVQQKPVVLEPPTREETRAWALENMPYKRCCITNYNESRFYRTLARVADKQGWDVFVKPKLIDICEVDGTKIGMNTPYREEIYDQLKGLVQYPHVDFLVCKKARQEDERPYVVCAIELDGESHQTDWKTQRNDEFKDAFFDALGYPLVRFENAPDDDDWTEDEIRGGLAQFDVKLKEAHEGTAGEAH